MRFGTSSNSLAFRNEIERKRKNTRFAQAKSLTFTAKELVSVSNKHTETAFDNPVSFTKKSAAFLPASKSKLTAKVFIKDIQAGYLELEETGGTRKPKRRYLPVPVNARKNKYGNMARRALPQLIARPDTFIGEINGTLGIWQRTKSKGNSRRQGSGGKNRGLRLLVYFTPETNYDKQFNWRAKMGIDAVKIFPKIYAIELRKAFGQ